MGLLSGILCNHLKIFRKTHNSLKMFMVYIVKKSEYKVRNTSWFPPQGKGKQENKWEEICQNINSSSVGTGVVFWLIFFQTYSIMKLYYLMKKMLLGREGMEKTII